jgi:hypothetical protein
MILRRKLIPWLVLILITLACSLPALPFLQSQPTPAGPIAPEFVNYPAPALSMDLTPFENAGCKPDEQGTLRCPPNLPPFDQFGCFEILAAPQMLGALTPAIPLMRCIRDQNPDQEPSADEYLFNQGCLVGSYVSYVGYRDGQFFLIKNKAELKAAFSPVDSADEALSFAMAATGFKALYGLKNDNMRYLVPQIADTQVKTEENQYRVSLYSFTTCGCGPHAMNLRVVLVKFTGDVVLNDPLPVWEDPAQDGLCVD